MNRMVLDQDLIELNEQVLHLGSLVANSLVLSLEALEKMNMEKASATIAADQEIDDLHLKVEQQTHYVVLLQQPLAGYDLRVLASLPPIAIDLERIGDEAVNIAKAIQRLGTFYAKDVSPTGSLSNTPQHNNPLIHTIGESFDEPRLIESLLKLGQQVLTILHGTLRAFADRDATAARRFWFEQTLTDKRSYIVQCELMNVLEYSRALPALENNPYTLQRIVYLLWITYHLERISSHCTNICERIVYMIDGDININ